MGSTSGNFMRANLVDMAAKYHGVSGCSAQCVTSTYFPGGENMLHYNIYSLFDVPDVRGWDPKQPAPTLATFGLI